MLVTSRDLEDRQGFATPYHDFLRTLSGPRLARVSCAGATPIFVGKLQKMWVYALRQILCVAF
ncbi:MAG: hypothetical protein ACYDEV_13245 [Acidiferrobacter sp.]